MQKNCSKQKADKVMRALLPIASSSFSFNNEGQNNDTAPGRFTLEREVIRLSNICLGNFCCKSSGSILKEYYPVLLPLFLNNLKHYWNSGNNSSTSWSSKMMSSILRSLNYTLLEHRNIYEKDLKWFFSILLQLIYFGSAKSLNLSTTADEKRLQRKRSNLASSDSDTDYDTDGNGSGSSNNHNWKVRYHAISCIGTLAKFAPKQLFGYWDQLFPTSFVSLSIASNLSSQLPPDVYTTTSNLHPNILIHSNANVKFNAQEDGLLRQLIEDSSAKVRALIAAVLTTILETANANNLLIAAKSPILKTAKGGAIGSYTAYSHKLSFILVFIHITLCNSLKSEISPSVFHQVLKCVGTLVRAAPYETLCTGVISIVVYTLHELLTRSTDEASLIGILNSIGACLCTKNHSEELRLYFLRGDQCQVDVIETLVKMLQSPSLSDLVRAEIFHVLVSLSKNYLLNFCVWWDQCVKEIIFEEIRQNNDVIKVSSSKVLAQYAQSISSATQLDVDDEVPPKEHQELSEEVVSRGLMLWHQFSAQLIFNNALQKEKTPVKLILSDALSYISPVIFFRTEITTQNNLVENMIVLSHDANATVRANALRALGMLLSHPKFHLNCVKFVKRSWDCLISAMRDQNLNTRIKAALGLANLMDCICRFPVDTKPSKDELLQLYQDNIKATINCMLSGLRDNDKVRANAVRGLGNVCKFISGFLLTIPSDKNGTIVDKIARELLEASEKSSVKVKWNVCYAFGNLFQNPALPQTHLQLISSQMFERLFDFLIDTLQQCDNFKVRINAASAIYSGLILVSHHPSHEKITAKVNKSIGLAIHKTFYDTQHEFTEYKYKQQLQKQLSKVLFLLNQIFPQGIDAIINLGEDVAENVLATLKQYKDSSEGKDLEQCIALLEKIAKLDLDTNFAHE